MHAASRYYVIVIFLHLIVACASQPDGLDAVIVPGTEPVLLNNELMFGFTEGPVYDARGTLYFTDGVNGRVYRMESPGSFTPVITGAGRPDGMMIGHDGNLVVCDFDAKRLDLYEPNGTFIRTLADSYQGKPLNGPNDAVIDRNGGIYFTDPFFQKPNPPQDAEALYYLPDGGRLRRVAADFVSPNGVIFTPDEQTLLVVDTQAPDIHAYDVHTYGSLSNHRIFGQVTLPPREQGEPVPRSGSVGVAMDTDGRLYVATDLGIEVFDSGGRSLGVLNLDEMKRPINMTFDRQDPYRMIITAYSSVYALRMKVRGISFPRLDAGSRGY